VAWLADLCDGWASGSRIGIEMDIGALAALAGSALVTATVTDAWQDARHKIARLFGRGQPDPVIGRRLDATHQQLAAAAPGELEQVRAYLTAQWQTRFADLLTDYPEAAGEVDAWAQEISTRIPTASDHSAAAGRDMLARADHGGAAANVVHGSVTAGPTTPGPVGS
jgi:phytoene dehydrogenase-like protein